MTTRDNKPADIAINQFVFSAAETNLEFIRDILALLNCA